VAANRISVLLLVSCAAVCATPPARADETFLVQSPAVYAPSATVSAPVKAECAPDIRLGNDVFESVSERFPGSLRIGDPAQAGDRKVLTLTIASAVGFGGGGWSGAKGMTVRANLVEKGRVLGTFYRQRTSKGGILGGVTGTCAIFGKITATLGKDIALWLATTAKLDAPEEAPKAEEPPKTTAPESPATPN
jgi:hypothetical protein